MFLLFIVLNSNLFFQIESAKILAFFPIPSISHQVVFRPLTQELAKQGHEVVVVTPDPAFPKGQAPARLKEIDVHEISYNYWEKFLATATGNKDDLATQLEVAFDSISMIFEKQLAVEEVQEIIKNKNNTFDLLLLEACAMPVLSLSHIYKAPVILVSSFGGLIGNYELLGAPNHPIFYPLPLRQRLYNLTTWETLNELYYNHFKMFQLFDDQEEKQNKALRKIFGVNFPGLAKLKSNVHMLFLNIHPIWDNNRPVPPNIIYMGGLHQKPRKELPSNLTSILDSSKDGVIYFSFGTNVDPALLPPEKIEIFLKVFSKLPYTILWKWQSKMSFTVSNNVKVMKWFPQSDLLRHPKIKLFITQGGLQSTDEAITGGVPLIGIPMLGDQWFNVEKYVHHGLGVRLDLDTLTEDKLLNAIKTVINDESYRKNVIKLRTLMEDQIQKPLDRAVWWIEHVLRHGGAQHLRTTSANLSWSQYYLLGYFVHIARRNPDNLNKLVVVGKIEGKRSQGRSLTRWSDQVLTTLGLDITTALRQVEDRTAWRQLVDTAVKAYQDKHDLQK
ncbi:Ecdysteroid UDP-glucosyltransferase [Papilio xuthus]|uniref:Ecdysteroid UDP-glucosyltransferase n=1 Tax=Papilio xuthus TaxID=66420 RepID=A0A0N1I2R8_PAPXU|nr:Ecdysteroid UDP-glucosyltransferase [Papilio xuthus]